MAGLGGALSGGAMGSYGGLFVNSRIKAIGEANSNNLVDIIHQGMQYDKNSTAYKNAVKLAKTNSEISNYDVGRQVLLNYSQEIETAISEGMRFDKDSEAYKNAAKLLKGGEEITADELVNQVALNNAEKSVNVGDAFQYVETGETLTVVERDGENTSVRLGTGEDAKIKVFPNKVANNLAINPNYKRVRTVEDTSDISDDVETSTATPAEVAITEDATTTSAKATVYNMLTGENLTNKQIDTIMTNMALRGAFESLTGVKIEGSEAEQRAIIREWRNNSANIENLKRKNVGGKGVSLTDAHTKVNELLGQLNGKNIGEIIRSETLTKAFEDLTGITLEGTTANKRATVRAYAELAKKAYAESVNAEAENASVTGDTATMSEDANTIDDSDAVVTDIVDAINETIDPDGLKVLFDVMSKSDNVERVDIATLAKSLRKSYRDRGTIGAIADYFTDGGKKVVEAIESTLDTTTEKTSEADLSNTNSESNLDNNLDNESLVETAQNKEEVLKNQSKSATIEEKITKAVPDAGKSHTVAYTNDNERVDLSFKVISVDDLVVSNSLDGKLNPDYPQELQPRDRSRTSSQSQIRQMANSLNPARLAESTSVSEGSPIVGADNVVESGNGRTLAIKLAYEIGTADEYKNHIIRNADKYGIDVSNLPEKPILVRERLTEVDRTEFTRKANESSISSLSATEQAKVDAENLTEDVLNLLVANEKGIINTSDNKSFISAVLSKVFKNEDLNNVVNAEGNLSTRGLERIKNAIFYKAYGDASLSARLSESLDNDMKNATTVLLNVAPKIVVIPCRCRRTFPTWTRIS